MAFFSKPVVDFIGKGITFPLELSNGKVVVKTGFDLISTSIQTILNWCGGQHKRFFLGEFNSKLDLLLEEPNDQITIDLLETFIQDSIARWEPRVKLLSLQSERQDESTIIVTGTYQIVNSATTSTFIFPFYTVNSIIH